MPATFKFIIYSGRTDVNGQAPIYLRILCDQKKRYYNTGIRIDPKYMRDDPDHGYWIKRSHPNYNTLNKQDLLPVFDKAQTISNELRRNKRESAQGIYERLQGASKENFFTIADEEIDYLATEDQFYLKKQTTATKNKLLEYHGSDVLKFTDINAGFIEGFQQWMKEKKGNKGSTIRKNMSDFRRILKRARKQNLIFDDPFEDVEPVKEDNPEPKVKLPYPDIKKLAAVHLPEGSFEDHVRNTFLLQFYLYGVRAGDMIKMRWHRITDGKISYHMGKNKKASYFSIPPVALDILDQYRTNGKGRRDVILPFLEHLTLTQRNDKATVENAVSSTLVDVNLAIKEVAKKAGIDPELADLVSTHVARHSLAKYLVDQEYSIYEISKRLRHSSITTTERYLERLGLQAVDQAIETDFK